MDAKELVEKVSKQIGYDVTARSRQMELFCARMAIGAWLKYNTNLTYPTIAKLLNVHRTSAYHYQRLHHEHLNRADLRGDMYSEMWATVCAIAKDEKPAKKPVFEYSADLIKSNKFMRTEIERLNRKLETLIRENKVLLKELKGFYAREKDVIKPMEYTEAEKKERYRQHKRNKLKQSGRDKFEAGGIRYY